MLYYWHTLTDSRKYLYVSTQTSPPDLFRSLYRLFMIHGKNCKTEIILLEYFYTILVISVSIAPPQTVGIGIPPPMIIPILYILHSLSVRS